MFVSQMIWTTLKGWHQVGNEPLKSPSLVLYFGTRHVLESGERYEELRQQFPEAVIMGATSGGEILNNKLYDNTVVVSLIQFENTKIKPILTNIKDSSESHTAGSTIASALKTDDLAGIFVLSDGVNVNGSSLVNGIRSVIGDNITITGGLASDGDLFVSTLVGVNEKPKSNCIGAIGLYGSSIQIGHGSLGGWDSFGPQRIITKSKNNILYELDGKPALSLYKNYLGDEAEKLPSSALLFPLSIKSEIGAKDTVVRTVLSVNEDEQSMTFAGDIPENYIAQLMYGNFEHLIEGASDSARQASETSNNSQQFGILISCIGRRLLMGQYISDELEAVFDFWRKQVPLTGFYSYGEISPNSQSGICDLHNQTMTITTFGENLNH